jgi:hypothetical protein
VRWEAQIPAKINQRLIESSECQTGLTMEEEPLALGIVNSTGNTRRDLAIIFKDLKARRVNS